MQIRKLDTILTMVLSMFPIVLSKKAVGLVSLILYSRR